MERKSRQLNDDDFCFSVSSESHSGLAAYDPEFRRTAVRRNTQTGEIQGWEEFYRLVCLDNP